MSREKVLIIVFLCCTIFGFGQGNILFGERNLNENKVAVYFDKEGFAYPNYFVSNSSMNQCNASLLAWYTKNQTDFFIISKKYNCSFTECSIKNCNILNDSILFSIQQRINKSKKEYTSVSFLIHGYRKPFVKSNGDRTSPADFQILEETLNQNLKTVYVEVYWDAMYDCCFSTDRKENKVLYHLLEEAEKNAVPVGHGLRKVLNNLSFDTVNVITHSLGAKVALEALCNASECIFPTPENKRVNICLIAPAISGEETFKNYYKRTTDFNYTNKDNYKLAILFNEKDFVLRKKVGWFGPGPYKYVNTTLGCNYGNCAFDLEKYFASNFSNSPIKLFNLTDVGQCHLVSCYCSSRNLKDVWEYFKK